MQLCRQGQMEIGDVSRGTLLCAVPALVSLRNTILVAFRTKVTLRQTSCAILASKSILLWLWADLKEEIIPDFQNTR